MRIQFIGIGKNPLPALARALYDEGVSISGSDEEIPEKIRGQFKTMQVSFGPKGWFPGKITKDLDAVIVGSEVLADNPELLRAKELGIPIYAPSEFLFEHAKHKTRIVIDGSYGKSIIISMVLHVLHYHKRDVDFVMGAEEGSDAKIHLTQENDFIIIEGRRPSSSWGNLGSTCNGYRPNIALLSGIAAHGTDFFPNQEKCPEQFSGFIDAIVKGGILVYNEEDMELTRRVEVSTNTIRRHPYHTPEHKVEDGITFLKTPEGDMPLEISGKDNLSHLAGAKWICQHLVVDEDDFYEAIGSFN